MLRSTSQSTTGPTPPGCTTDSLAAAITAFRQTLTAGQVLTGEAAGADHTDPYAFTEDGFLPSAVVGPTSVEEVQDVVRIAGEHRVPLWTVSTGRNLGYGGAAPRVSGSVVVDLQRMNRVLEVNTECGYALVEPGVRFSDLYEHLRSNDYPLLMSVPDLGLGSLIGNTLERGFGYTPYGDHSTIQCGMEIVLADGDLVRTGMGAMDGNSAWSLYKGGFGPGHDSLMYQSNFGIVTKMGIWLMPQPEHVTVCMAKARDESDLAALVDTLRPLLIEGTIQSNAVVGNTLAVASMITDRRTWYDGAGAMPEEAIASICHALGLGRWNARFAVYGSKELVEARLTRVRSRFKGIRGLEFVTTEYAGDATADQVHPADRAQMGIPSTDLIRMAGWRGGTPAHTDFSLVCPPTGRDAVAQMQLIRKRVKGYGFDYAGGFTVNPRHAIALALVSFDRDSDDERAKVARMFPELISDAATAGYAPYRSHLAFMDTIADQYGFNDHANRRLNQRLKDALDPSGILSPGKQGIWPPLMR